MYHAKAKRFGDWRDTARRFLNSDIAPCEIRWIDTRPNAADVQSDLFSDSPSDLPPASKSRSEKPRVPTSFLAVAKTVAHHRNPGCWELLYRILWRLTHDEPQLMNIESNPDVVELKKLEKAVRRDAHKMKAFVRFRKVDDEHGEHFIAWHRPDHYSLRYTSDFFARRFDVMRWTIMTPDESCHWNGTQLSFAEGMPRGAAPSSDELETLWKAYYVNIFNPARIKLRAMRAEMPKKHWPTLPETQMIDEMLRDAPRRVDQMVQNTNKISNAQQFIPDTHDIDLLRESAMHCQGCMLCDDATQTVFGSGPAETQTVFIGEQPGDHEDRLGRPFVGPAGKLLSDFMKKVGLDRDSVYLTNAVKHFKFTRSGKRRLHKTPSAREVAACRPWLMAELEIIRPKFILCLGATAARVIFGPNFRITEQRGHVFKTEHATWTMATYHPSALLRSDELPRTRLEQDFETDLTTLARAIRDQG